MTFAGESPNLVRDKAVYFLTDHQLGHLPGGKTLVAAGASARLRVIYPSSQLARLGWTTRVIGLRNTSEDDLIAATTYAKFAVVSKIFRPQSVMLVESLSKRGVKLIVDFCDNHLDYGEFQAAHKTLLTIANRCIANTPVMHHVLRAHGYLGPINVIEDMVEHPRIGPRSIPESGQLNLIAFGSKLVCTHLQQWFPGLQAFAKERRPLTLEIVTLIDGETIAWERRFRNLNDDKFRFSISQWNEIGMEQAFRRADIAIIPSIESDFNKTKSANRLVEATNAGLPVLAYPLNAYLPFGDNAFLTKNVFEGLTEIVRDPIQTNRRVAYTQDLIEISRNNVQIAEQWQNLFRSIDDAKEASKGVGLKKITILRDPNFKVLSVTAAGTVNEENPITVELNGDSNLPPAIMSTQSILEVFDRYGIPSWVESYAENDVGQIGHLGRETLAWEVDKICRNHVPYITKCFKNGTFAEVLLSTTELLNRKAITEFEAHEFLASRYHINDPWNVTISGALWRQVMTRVSQCATILNEYRQHNEEQQIALETISFLSSSLLSYFIIKHFNSHNLLMVAGRSSPTSIK